MQAFVIVAIIVTALAATLNHVESSPQGYEAVPALAPLIENSSPYQFQWEVAYAEGNNYYGHGERRDGALTSGSYFILLPDGRRQRVDYTVEGDSGYIATVTYE